MAAAAAYLKSFCFESRLLHRFHESDPKSSSKTGEVLKYGAMYSTFYMSLEVDLLMCLINMCMLGYNL